MTQIDIASALAAAHREELLRLAARDRVVVTRSRRRRTPRERQQRNRLAAWLDAQLFGRRRTQPAPSTCAAVTR